MKTLDLFCGCGGMSLGFSLAGHEILAGFDNWEKALGVYRENFTHPVFKCDLMDVEVATNMMKEFLPEMVIGGPPCQDFSSAGKRNEEGGRGCLTVCYARIVERLRPKWFVMENVERILKTQKLIEARAVFSGAGYGLTACVLDASLCGVPQIRKRFFLVGRLGAVDNFLLPFIRRNLAQKPLSIAEYMGDELDFEFYYRHPRSYARRGVFSVHEPSPTIRGVNRPMPKGYPLHHGDPVESLEGIRALTTEERSRIQTFPRKFRFLGSKTEIEQMIGNAVPVNLAKFVGNAIRECEAFMESSAKDPSAGQSLLSFKELEAEPQLSLFE